MLHQAMYMAGTDKYISRDQMIKNVNHLPVLAWVFYHITAYQVISLY